MAKGFEPSRSRARVPRHGSDYLRAATPCATEHNAQKLKIAYCAAIAHKRVTAAANP